MGRGKGVNGRLSCGSPRAVALGIFGALTKLKSAANYLPYTSQVALGLFGQCSDDDELMLNVLRCQLTY